MDDRYGRDTMTVNTVDCVSTMESILEKVLFEGWKCGACPVAIIIRCHELYMEGVPLCTLLDFCNVIYCNWLLMQFDLKLVPDVVKYLKHLPHAEFPDLLNRSSKFKLNLKSTLSLGKCNFQYFTL
jgi:hypothetical protein